MGVLKNTFIQHLTLKGYSQKTIKSYTYRVEKLALHYNTPPTQLSEKQVRDFFVHIKEKEKLSPVSFNQYHASIKFFYSIYNKDFMMKSIPRCKGYKSKPVILSKNEVFRILDCIDNLKHKTLISLLYSAGLRISEATNLKLTDIDRDRCQIFVRSAKGNKDRYTILSKKSRQLLDFLIKKNPASEYIFYSNHNKKVPIHIRTIQKVFQEAVLEAGISKKISPHSLRHSFATHLLEEGVNIRYIQTLLGHANLTSTSMYLHTISLDKLNISSPLDTNP